MIYMKKCLIIIFLMTVYQLFANQEVIPDTLEIGSCKFDYYLSFNLIKKISKYEVKKSNKYILPFYEFEEIISQIIINDKDTIDFEQINKNEKKFDNNYIVIDTFKKREDFVANYLNFYDSNIDIIKSLEVVSYQSIDNQSTNLNYKLMFGYPVKADNFEIIIHPSNYWKSNHISFKDLIIQKDSICEQTNYYNCENIVFNRIYNFQFHKQFIPSFEKTIIDNQTYILITDSILQVKKELKLPNKIVWYWDVSESYKIGSETIVNELLNEYLKELGEVELLLIEFSNSIISKKLYKIKNGNGEELFKHLNKIIYYGSSRLDQLDFFIPEVDEYFLFTDGNIFLGNYPKLNTNTPVHCISFSQE